MANRKLTSDQMKEFEELVLAGKTPQDLADHFGFGVSTVHNYKTQLKETGVLVPNVRGKRPSGVNPAPFVPLPHRRDNVHFLEDVLRTVETTNLEEMHLTINGVSLRVGSGAKAVEVDKDHVTIRF